MNHLSKQEKDEQIEELYQDEQYDRLQQPLRLGRGVIATSIILAIIFGILAGFGGGLVVLSIRKIPLLNISLDNYLSQRNIVVETPISVKSDKKQINLTSANYKDIIGKLQRQSVTIYTLKQQSSRPFINQFYVAKQSLGQGIIVSADGWVITNSVALPKLDPINYLVITADQQGHLVEKIISDPATSLVFMKLSNVSGLPPAQFANDSESSLGQAVLLMNAEGQIKMTNLVKQSWQNNYQSDDLIHSSDLFFDFALLDQTISSDYIGSPVMNLLGRVIGSVVRLENKAIAVCPIEQFDQILTEVLEQQTITRPYLGIEYLELSELTGMTDSGLIDCRYGALLYGNPTVNSPAAKVGLVNRDIIIKIDQDIVDRTNSLTKLIQQYKSGDELAITYLRDGEERSKIVILETNK